MGVRIDRHDSPLGRWLLARWEPPHLEEAVHGIWYFEGSLVMLRERHFPHGRLELIVHLGPVYRRVEGERVETFARRCISGLQLESDLIEAPPGPTAVLGVQLRPPGAYRLLGLPLSELTGITVDLDDVTAGAARELAERCEAEAAPEARVMAAARWIEARLRAGPEPDAAVRWAARELERRNGAVSIASVRQRTGWSRTRFTNTFREQTGVTPKTLARILRFRHSMDMLNQRDAPLSEIALAAGYYDQPHFNAEFRELAGCPPGEYRALSRFPDSPSVPEP